ncbi:MAG: hypothetical protein ACRD12_19680 [Acidimicrobiales bacterium]
MGAETVATLVITAVIVAVLALFLITIGLRLQKLSFTIGTIIVGLRAIREQTKPIDGVLGSIVGDVTAIEGALGGVLEAVGGGAAPVEAESMADAVARARGEVVKVDAVAEVVEYSDDGEDAYEDEDEYEEEEGEGEEEYEEEGEYEEEEEEPEPLFEVPTRSRRGGSGMAEAVARARERIAAGR